MKWISCIAILTLFSSSHASAQIDPVTPLAKPILVNVQENLERLIEEEDTDGDKKITVEDAPILKKGRGDKRFWLISCDGKRYEVAGTFCLANLLQELKLSQDAGFEDTEVDLKRIFESPVARLSRSIREIYWDSLTRRIDGKNLGKMVRDKKIATTGYRYVYVPHSDTAAYAYFSRASKEFPDLKVRVERLPAKITPEYVRSLEGKHGLLVLAMKQTSKGKPAAVPFVVPGGRFNEMYGWDSYFIASGLLADGRVNLARSMVDNLVYQSITIARSSMPTGPIISPAPNPLSSLPWLWRCTRASLKIMKARPGLRRCSPQPLKNTMESGWIKIISPKQG